MPRGAAPGQDDGEPDVPAGGLPARSLRLLRLFGRGREAGARGGAEQPEAEVGFLPAVVQRRWEGAEGDVRQHLTAAGVARQKVSYVMCVWLG